MEEITNEPAVDAVMADNRAAAEALASHLVDHHGYRRLAAIVGPATWPSTVERLAGYRAALAERGLPVRPERVITALGKPYTQLDAPCIVI